EPYARKVLERHLPPGTDELVESRLAARLDRPRLLGQFVAAGVLDELCLTVSPVLTAGDAQRIAGGPAVAVPSRFALASVLEEDGFLFTRYRRAAPV
ncbi:hypothetical protein ACE14D_16130, partial [Streptomyces sp. Act-28]